MNKKKTPTDDEQNAFRQAVAGVKPLTQRDDKIMISHKLKEDKSYRRQQASIEQRKLPPLELQRCDYGIDDSVLFSRPGLQHKYIKKLKKGQLPWQATLDLHGLTLAEAEFTLEQFINYCQERGYRHTLIIHGKGFRSKGNKPLLKNLTIQYLQEHPQILAVSSALPKDGGTGAVYVILKRQ